MVINIPGYGHLEIMHLVLDYNGTIAKDGILLPEVKECLNQLAHEINIHVITSDTHGNVSEQCKYLPVQIKVLNSDNHVQEKADYVNQLDSEQVVAIGNGLNDAKMLYDAKIGVAVIQTEGCSVKALSAADIVVNHIVDGLNLLLKPHRLIADLRKK